MEKQHSLHRRDFMAAIIPPCAAACLAGVCGTALADTNKFEQKHDPDLSYAEYYAVQYREFIKLAQAFEQEWGKDKLLEFLTKKTQERTFKRGQDQAKKLGNNSLAAYVEQFRPPHYEKSLTHSIVEDTETTFQMQVTECIWAKTFLDADAGEIGYAHICCGDYTWAKGFNEKMHMERDKTLMQGDAYCNHRYVIEI